MEITLCMTCGIAAEQNHRKCHIWNIHDHATTLLMAISEVEILALCFLV